jgi:hypothetical protein
VESRYAQYVGRTAPPRTYEVERGHVRRFFEAVSGIEAEWTDEAAPPTFATCLRPNDPRDGLDIDWRKLLHGEQEFTYRRPLYPGDRVTVVQRIAEASVKQGKSGDMDLLVLVTEGKDDRGELLFTARSTVVVRR